MVIKVVHKNIYINNFMNYLLNYYKNLSEQLERKYQQLILEVAEAMPTELTVTPVEQDMAAVAPPPRGTGKPAQPKPNQPNQGDGWNTPPQPPTDPGPQPQRGQPPAPTSETEEQYRRRFEEWSRQKSIYDTYRSICPTGNCTGPRGRPIRIFYWPTPPHPSAPGYGTGSPGNTNPYLRDGDIWIDQRGKPQVWSTTPNDGNPKFRPYTPPAQTPPAQKPPGAPGTGNNTTPRKNNQNGLQVEQKISKLLNRINEAKDGFGARPYYGYPVDPGDSDEYRGYGPSENFGWPGYPTAPKPPWWNNYVRQWHINSPTHRHPYDRGPKPGYDTIPDVFQQPNSPLFGGPTPGLTPEVPGFSPGVYGPPTPGVIW